MSPSNCLKLNEVKMQTIWLGAHESQLCYVLCAVSAVTAMLHDSNVPVVVTTHIVNLPHARVQCSLVASDLDIVLIDTD